MYKLSEELRIKIIEVLIKQPYEQVSSILIPLERLEAVKPDAIVGSTILKKGK